MCSSVIKRLLAGAALPLTLAAIAAPSAQAESIAYVKDGNVWLSTPDGGRQHQVTNDGGYSYVSQSDLGTIVALHGDRIRTLDRETGAVRHDILTPASSSYPGTQFRGPFDPVISPDGTKIAYTWYFTEYGETPSCNPSTGCNTVYGRQGTGFTRPDRITGFDDYGFQSRSGCVSPSWMDDGSVISSDPIQVGNEQTAFMTPGDESIQLPGATQPWWSNTEVRSLRDVERNRQKTGFAAVAGDANEAIHVYRPGNDYPNLPSEACFQITGPKGRYQGPSWKPDGSPGLRRRRGRPHHRDARPRGRLRHRAGERGQAPHPGRPVPGLGTRRRAAGPPGGRR